MWKKYSLQILIIVLLIILPIGLFNWLVDPYDIFESPKIAGFNMNKPEANTHARLYKAMKLQIIKPEIIILGTSRALKGMDSENQNLASNKSWNSAVSSGLPFEYEMYIDTAIKNGAKHIIIGTDLFAFYTKDLTKEGIDKETFNKLLSVKYLFSVDALLSSIKTVGNKNHSGYLPSGMQDPLMLQSECDRIGGHKRNFIFSEKTYPNINYGQEFSKTQVDHWQAFERILDKAQKRGVKITLFISPSHARQWEVLDITQGWGVFEEFRRKLVLINEKVAIKNNKAPFVLWDFTGYHQLTTETVPDDPKTKMRWYWDSSHYKKELGDIVFDRMFDGNFSGGQDYPDFGVKLTSQNIEAHLLKLRNEREQWRLTHPQDVKEIEALKTTKSK